MQSFPPVMMAHSSRAELGYVSIKVSLAMYSSSMLQHTEESGTLQVPRTCKAWQRAYLGLRSDSSCMRGCSPVMIAHSSRPKL